MEALIGDMDTKLGVGGGNGDSTQKWFSNINVNADASKSPFFSKEGIMVDSNDLPNGPKQVSENRFLPEFPRQARNSNPLVNSFNRN